MKRKLQRKTADSTCQPMLLKVNSCYCRQRKRVINDYRSKNSPVTG